MHRKTILKVAEKCHTTPEEVYAEIRERLMQDMITRIQRYGQNGVRLK